MKNNRPLVYLAAPYTDKSPAVMKDRIKKIDFITCQLLSRGEFVYSPITHCNVIATKFGLPHDFDYWHKNDLAFISCCHILYVLMLKNWENSKGVSSEIQIAKKQKIKIKYLDYNSFTKNHS